MKNNITIVEQKEVLGREFKIYGDIENPLFLAKDVAEMIEHSNARMLLQTIDEEEKVVKNVYTLGGTQESLFITEDGLYEVLMQSRKPIAKQFKKEVKQILKDIRKRGMYMTNNLLEKTLQDPNYMLSVITAYAEEKQARQVAEAKVEQFLDTENLLSWDTVAKNLNIGRNTMLKALRDLKILQTDEFIYRGKTCRGEKHNIPYQAYMKYFEVKYIVKNDKRVAVTKVSAKGQEYLYKKLTKENILAVA